jgi:hypothetical protein
MNYNTYSEALHGLLILAKAARAQEVAIDEQLRSERTTFSNVGRHWMDKLIHQDETGCPLT